MFEVLKHRIASWQSYNRTMSELRALSDRDLSDIGIHRSDINRIARTASRQKSLSRPV
jgi:uncharacterized protein YjiS (DUF1127 family)